MGVVGNVRSKIFLKGWILERFGVYLILFCLNNVHLLTYEIIIVQLGG